MNVAYVVEITVFLIASIIETIIFVRKDVKKALKFILITLILFIVSVLITFMLEKPVINLDGFEEIEAKTKISKPYTTYHFKNITNEIIINGDIDTEKVGEYEVKLEVPIFTGKYEENIKVKVVDTTPPELVLEGELDCIDSYQNEFTEPGYTAKDSYDGDLSESVKVEKEEINDSEYNLVYTVSDSSGNTTTQKRHIKVTDDFPPVIELNGNANIYMNIGENYEELGATAIDEKDGDVSKNLVIEGEVNTGIEGVYTITYTAKDKSENIATVNRYVLVSNSETVYPQDGTTGKKSVIYLTFDDGPTETSTPKILDILDKKGVKATFFIINYNENTEELVKREHESGHTVAIHGYSHTYSQIYQSVDTYLNNVEKLREKIKNSIGVDSTITRFPGGSSNTISRHYCQKIMTTLAYEMVSRGYTYFDWNVDSDDAGSAKTSDDVYRNVTSRLSKDKANVVLMHDFSNNNKTIEALEAIIDYGLQNGYTFEPITEQTQMVTHSTNN